ncbi:F-box protein [Cardamine amara subsp. amara]|uniref:F-box protein n=1 Tax=Cardamine amara subsp. amara TaxID=228776 RepID=A0ABD1B2E5_CARAN
MAFSFDRAVILQRERRRTKRRSKGIREICTIHEPSREIPFDLVNEILMRLPAKSLMRFKSVSKLWSSLICSKHFSNRLLKLSSPPRLYMYLSFSDKSQLNERLLSLSPADSDITMSSFVIDQDLTIPAMRGYYLSHVFRGLMCFVNQPSAQIYNTSTRQLVVLPDIEESNMIAEDHKNRKIMYRIGQDTVYDQYKVVCTVARSSDEVGEYTFLSEHWVLPLGGDGSSRWRKIQSPCPPHLPLTQAFNINGRMHYLAWIRVSVKCVLVSFDINSEEFSIVQVPEDIFWAKTGFIEYDGKVALLHYTYLEKEGVMELWVVEDAEKNMWSSKTLVVHPAQMRMIDSISLNVLGTTRNGQVILAPEDTNLFNIFLYDLQKNHIRKIEIKGAPECKICKVVGLDDVDNLMHF